MPITRNAWTTQYRGVYRRHNHCSNKNHNSTQQSTRCSRIYSRPRGRNLQCSTRLQNLTKADRQAAKPPMTATSDDSARGRSCCTHGNSAYILRTEDYCHSFGGTAAISVANAHLDLAAFNNNKTYQSALETRRVPYLASLNHCMVSKARCYVNVMLTTNSNSFHYLTRMYHPNINSNSATSCNLLRDGWDPKLTIFRSMKIFFVVQ